MSDQTLLLIANGIAFLLLVAVAIASLAQHREWKDAAKGSK